MKPYTIINHVICLHVAHENQGNSQLLRTCQVIVFMIFDWLSCYCGFIEKSFLINRAMIEMLPKTLVWFIEHWSKGNRNHQSCLLWVGFWNCNQT